MDGTIFLIPVLAFFLLFFGRNGGKSHQVSNRIDHGRPGISNSGPGIDGSTSGPNSGCIGLVLMFIIGTVILGLIATGLGII